MAEKLDKFRQIAQRLKDKVHLPQFNTASREKVDQIITRYAPANKVTEFAEKFKQEALTKKVKELVTKYEKFTGVEEIMALQNTVIDAQERFMQAQERRRDIGRQVADIESRLKELHSEMQNTMKGDDKYLHMCTEEHKLIIQERALRTLFSEAEREERELFATMSAAVKLGHERERAHAERNKYWYIVASIFGTVLGIAGSTINNRLKMAEFRDMMEQQMARSASVLFTIAGGGSASRADITEAMKTEFKYQAVTSNLTELFENRDLEEVVYLRNNDMNLTSLLKKTAKCKETENTMKKLHGAQLAENIKNMQDNINYLLNKQASVIDHLNHQEHAIETQIRELKRLVITASQSSARSDAQLAKALSTVHQENSDIEVDKDMPEPEVSIDSNQVWTAVGVVVVAALIFGNILGRVS